MFSLIQTLKSQFSTEEKVSSFPELLGSLESMKVDLITFHISLGMEIKENMCIYFANISVLLWMRLFVLSQKFAS